jgi:hypothetical protein
MNGTTTSTRSPNLRNLEGHLVVVVRLATAIEADRPHADERQQQLARRRVDGAERDGEAEGSRWREAEGALRRDEAAEEGGEVSSR